jgi:hypothetical protein
MVMTADLWIITFLNANTFKVHTFTLCIKLHFPKHYLSDKIVVNLCKEGLTVTSDRSVFWGFFMKATMPDLLNFISKKLDFSSEIFFDWITNLM